MDFTVVIPAHNEGQRIQETLSDVLLFFRNRRHSTEKIVVDDGSRDDTVARARLVEGGPIPIKVLKGGRHQGKGNAVRRGIAHAQGDRILVTNADLSVPISQLPRLEEVMEAGSSIVVGVRVSSQDTKAPAPSTWSRLTALAGNVLTRVAAPPLWDIRDSRCGFRLFRGDVARTLFGQQTVDGFGYDVEILYLAQRRGYRITQVDVEWYSGTGRRAGLLHHLITALELVQVRVNSATGKYDE